MSITVYTDGAAKGNPGKGGYGVVMISGNLKKEFSQGYLMTTNNRMELLAVIIALEKIKKTNSDVVVYSDSKYVVNPIEKQWLQNWKKTGFKNKKNVDLWLEFLSLFEKYNDYHSNNLSSNPTYKFY